MFKSQNTNDLSASSDKQSRPKAPTTYQYFKDATSGQKKSHPAVEAIFPPSEAILSWGFMSGMMRFNVYERDPRYAECQAIVDDITTNGKAIRIVYSPTDYGLATLEPAPRLKTTWRKVGSFWLADNSLTK